MKSKHKDQYRPTEELITELDKLKGKKFTLSCGHKVTLGFFLGNNIVVRNGKHFEVVCTECAY